MGQLDDYRKAQARSWCLATLMLLPACTTFDPISPQLTSGNLWFAAWLLFGLAYGSEAT